MQYIVYILIITASAYSQDCNQSNWQQYSPNLEECDLAGVNIAWTDISGFNFSGANLTNSNLTGSNFSGANLTSAILIDADLTWAIFIGANLTNANLSGAGLGAADFTDANLFGANLYGTIIFDTNFSNACIENTYGFPSSGYIGEPILQGCASSNPNWSVDPGQFEYNMALTARVYDEYMVDMGSENDIIGAFNEGECVGLAEAAEVPVFLGGGYAFLVQIYSHEFNGDEIEFQYYNIAMDTVYDIAETIFFESDAMIGDVVSSFPLFILAQNNNNNPPEAESSAYTLDEDNMITVYLSATDGDGDALTFTIHENPNNGTVTLSGIAATYYPDANYNGVDSFSFIVSDGQNSSNSATIDLMINAINDAPYLYDIPDAAVNAGELFIYQLEAVDVDGDDLTYASTIVSGDGAATLSNNVLTVQGAPNSTLDISIAVSDGAATDQTSFVLTFLAEPCEEEYEQGFLDGAATGDVNGDGALNIVDIVFFIDMILNGE